MHRPFVNSHKNRHKDRGFTLIELVVAMAIVAVLAAIALPAYQGHIRKTRRSVAAACLQELAQQMERRYAISMSYVGTALPVRTCMSDLAGSYEFQFSTGQPTALAFSIQATPQNTQAQDEDCATLSVDHLGNRGRSGTADVKSCWP